MSSRILVNLLTAVVEEGQHGKLITMIMMKNLLLLLVVLSSVLSASAYDFVQDGIYYNINGNELTVTKDKSTYSSYTGDVVIPDTVVYNGVTYTVTAIESLAFRHCYQMPSITLPNTLKTIGDSAFIYCYGLKSFYVPKSVSSIGYATLSACNDLTSLIVDPENPYYDSRDSCNAIIETSTDKLVQGGGPTVIPNGVKIIGRQAFDYCRAMKNIVLPNSVKKIETRAFFLADFDSFTFNDSLEVIEPRAFLTCEGMFGGNVRLPKTITYIGPWAFALCNLQYISMVNDSNSPYYSTGNCIIERATKTLVVGSRYTYIPYGVEVKAIGEAAFAGNINATDLRMPRGITEIGPYAFFKTFKAYEINIPEGVTTIGNYAFSECGAWSLSIPSTLKNIGRGVFQSCSGLSSVTIPETVETIDYRAFEGCTKLNTLTIGSGVTQIGEEAFTGCNALTTITCNGEVPPVMLSDNCFTSTAYENATLYVPSASLNTYKNTDYWNLFFQAYGNTTGDANGDGEISITDVTALIDALLGSDGAVINKNADLNGDGVVSILDVTALIDMLLSTSN